MRVLLISANTETTNMVPLPLGLNCVAVATRNAGHDVRLLDLMESGNNAALIREVIEAFRPRVIGVSVRNVDNQSMAETRFLLEPVRETIELCRSFSGATIVLGGAGFSIFPEAVLRFLGADMGICGEGEAAFTALLRTIEEGEDPTGIPGLCLPGKDKGTGSAGACPPPMRTASRCPMDELPLPDPDLWHIPAEAAGDLWIPYQTRRGCPMRCSYCSTPTLEGTAIRKRTIAAVVKGIGRHVEAGFDRFYFVDNTFNLPPEYAKELCDALSAAKLGIRWRCILYPGSVDEEVVRKMAEAGCVEVSLGFESGSPAMLKMLNKHYDLDQVRAASAWLRQYGISRMGFLLLGGPGETKETVRQSLDFAESLNLDMLKVTIGIRIYPETALERVARDEGAISEGDDLLFPRFYLAQGAEEWRPMVMDWIACRPYCTM